MAGREFSFATGNYYHIFNRGAAKQTTFITDRDYRRGIETLSYYRFTHPPIKFSRLYVLSQERRREILNNLTPNDDNCLVNILSFALMPTHFHFLVKQNVNFGISVFISKFTNSYTKYFNTKNHRIGALFQGVFKAVSVDSEEQLLHLSRYIHLNPLVDRISDNWTSLKYYTDSSQNLIDTKPVLSHFSSVGKYLDFVRGQIEYGTRLEEYKHKFLDQ